MVMSFSNKLERALITKSLYHIDDEPELQTIILSEEERSFITRIIDVIKRLLKLDIKGLFRMAEASGTVTSESVIVNDLWPDILCEALDKVIAKTVFQGNYDKVVELKASYGGTTYRGYVIEKLDSPDTEIEKSIMQIMTTWKPGQPVPFQWYRTHDDALRALGQEETKQSAAGRPTEKPIVGKPISYKELLQDPTKTKVAPDIKQTAAAAATNMGRPDLANKIVKLDRDELERLAESGKHMVKQDSTWKTAKNIFLVWLALGALVTGPAGIAALIVGYFITKALEKAKFEKDSTKEAERVEQFERLKEKIKQASK